MHITVKDILDVGKLVQCKLPDLYWDIDLTGAELKVLRYVYENSIRLYTTVKIYPRSNDKTPQFWRNKELMARDCGLSLPTFRNSVRKLASIGLVTSMDAPTHEDDDQDQEHFISLSSKFIEGYATEALKNYKTADKTAETIILTTIYNRTTLVCLKESLNKKKPLYKTLDKALKDTLYEKIRTPIITGYRQAITKEDLERSKRELRSEKIIANAKKKLKEMKGVITPQEASVLKIAEYYEYKCRKVLHSSGYRALGKDFRSHKNWKPLNKIHDLCVENGWDYKIYIDAQFERCKGWKRKQPYPYLNQCYSDNAQKYYSKYIKDYKETYSVTKNIKVKTEKVQTVSQELVDSIVKDCTKMREYLDKAVKQRRNAGIPEQDLKMEYILQHWDTLSAYYLSSSDSCTALVNSIQDSGKFTTDLKEHIRKIRASKKLLSDVKIAVTETEAQLHLPSCL